MEEKNFITKDSGERENFETWAVRDTSKWKLRWDLIPVEALKRVAGIYTRGAEKYDDNNWKKGIPVSRMYESALRHLMSWRLNPNSEEDELAAVIFNLLGIMYFQETGRTDLFNWEFQNHINKTEEEKIYVMVNWEKLLDSNRKYEPHKLIK